MSIQNSTHPAGSLESKLTQEQSVNWRQVISFIALTFGLTWLLDLVLFLKGGLTHPATLTALQFQMLLPAFSAMILGVFFFKDSPLYFKTNFNRSRWFVYYFLFYSLLYLFIVILSFIKPDYAQSFAGPMLIPGLLGIVLWLILRITGGKNTFVSIHLSGGKPRYWILFGLCVVVFAASQTALNWVFNWGQSISSGLLAIQAASAGLSVPMMMIILSGQTILLGPFLGLLITLGEEYGWRGYLQPALIKIGKKRGILLTGIIWGLWHLPIIWMGYNYPGHPLLGSLLMVLFCIVLGFFLGYVVLKTKAVLLSAFLHALVNQTFAFFMSAIYTPDDTAFSFGIGLPGLAVAALLLLLVFRDPIWKSEPAE